ncbi:hypothetical protein HYPSUDRAFT_347449 [Hypholoma sublateritium FD-334 SS-4]|uniref:Uncharacterized protein n=1 Tax=Hypholoma sublateritium (strain FD-334 SS-4) TaxID=945553 RepID=A0A0D2PBV7_HYPSF|nr:hypothetical protein HYPSUDRAFT_347449 [Hypholoma sublateritium FD-334 SS-4]
MTMPRTPRLKSNPDSALHYHGLAPAVSHQYSISNLDRVKYHSLVFQVKRKHQSHGSERNTGRLEDADCRASGRIILRRPSVDRLQCKGRTIYDVQYTPFELRLQHSLSEIPTATAPSSRGHRLREKALGPRAPRCRSLIEETLNQAESGRAIRRLSAAFAFDILTAHQGEEAKWDDQARREILCEGERTPSLTWSSSAGGSDTEEALVEHIPEEELATNAPLVANPLTGNFESFAIKEGHLINPLESLGPKCDPWAQESNPEYYEAADQFFDMFVNTDDCEECY